MKYYKLSNEVFAFDDDQLDLVKSNMVEMTSIEVDQHLFPEKYLSDSDLLKLSRERMPNLSPIEFEIKLYKAGMYDEVRAYIDNVASVPMKIAYNRATFFNRTDSFITTAMRDLSLTDEQVDAIWNA